MSEGPLTEAKSESKQELQFTPEALEALAKDLAFLQALFTTEGGIQTQTLDTLTGAQPFATSIATQPTRAIAGAARDVVDTAGAARGVSPRSRSVLGQYLASEEPVLLTPVAAQLRKQAGDIESLVDPRLAAFLKPDVLSKGSSQPSPLRTATQVVQLAGGVAGAVAT